MEAIHHLFTDTPALSAHHPGGVYGHAMMKEFRGLTRDGRRLFNDVTDTEKSRLEKTMQRVHPNFHSATDVLVTENPAGKVVAFEGVTGPVLPTKAIPCPEAQNHQPSRMEFVDLLVLVYNENNELIAVKLFELKNAPMSTIRENVTRKGQDFADRHFDQGMRYQKTCAEICHKLNIERHSAQNPTEAQSHTATTQRPHVHVTADYWCCGERPAPIRTGLCRIFPDMYPDMYVNIDRSLATQRD